MSDYSEYISFNSSTSAWTPPLDDIGPQGGQIEEEMNLSFGIVAVLLWQGEMAESVSARSLRAIAHFSEFSHLPCL